MTHLLPVASAFLAVPCPPQKRDTPDRGGGLPLLFLVFYLICAALSVIEAFWPSLAAAISAIQAVAMPQL